MKKSEVIGYQVSYASFALLLQDWHMKSGKAKMRHVK